MWTWSSWKAFAKSSILAQDVSTMASLPKKTIDPFAVQHRHRETQTLKPQVLSIFCFPPCLVQLPKCWQARFMLNDPGKSSSGAPHPANGENPIGPSIVICRDWVTRCEYMIYIYISVHLYDMIWYDMILYYFMLCYIFFVLYYISLCYLTYFYIFQLCDVILYFYVYYIVSFYLTVMLYYIFSYYIILYYF